MYGYIWLGAVVLFAVLEILTVQLVSIWFVGGAAAALIAYLCGADFSVQMYICIGVSVLLLVATRPLVKKKFKSGAYERTNADDLIDKEGVVTDTINNARNTGTVKINGMPWSARSTDGEVIEKDTAVVIKRIEGVKLIVKKSAG